LKDQSGSVESTSLFSDMQTSDLWYMKVLDSLNNGILVANRQMVVQYVNAEYTRITGVPAVEIVGRDLTSVRPGAMLPEVIHTGKPLLGVYRREKEIEYVVDMAPIVINGDVVGAVSIVKDITEVKRLSEELQKNAKKTSRLKSIVDRMYQAKYTFEAMTGASPQILETIRLAKRVALGGADILIFGESGTGKEVLAQAIHNFSNRSVGPFVAVNCAAITPSLIESELFGYAEGAFTGAKTTGRLGLFEISSGGTVFLDEITELNLEMQAKLLRVLQERSVRRLGESNEISVDIRVIAATNKDLHSMVQDKTFRMDLYYRLNVLNVVLPPLRERGADIVLLAETLLQEQMRKLGRNIHMGHAVMDILKQHDWPGNIRELKNVIEYAVNMCEDNTITSAHLPKWLRAEANWRQNPLPSLSDQVREFERAIVAEMIERYGNNMEAKRRIAKELNISVATLYNKMKEIEINEIR
jgi:sigma-54 dependent transcriptional regulator, acetoin dehydrogenase operon transcriptional activator AcoR